MASRTSRKEWVRGLPSAFGVGRYDRKQVHTASQRSVGYDFLIGESVRNHPNPHPYQTGSKFPRTPLLGNLVHKRASYAFSCVAPLELVQLGIAVLMLEGRPLVGLNTYVNRVAHLGFLVFEALG